MSLLLLFAGAFGTGTPEIIPDFTRVRSLRVAVSSAAGCEVDVSSGRDQAIEVSLATDVKVRP